MIRLDVVMWSDPDDSLLLKVRDHYEPSGVFYEFSSLVAIVRSEDSARALRTKLGIGDEGEGNPCVVC